MRKCVRCGKEKEDSEFKEVICQTYGRVYLTRKCRNCINTQKRETAYFEKIFRAYGITIGQYELMLKSQKGVCAICNSSTTKHKLSKYFSIDHNHKTQKVRGLLCDHCNRGLGYFENNPKLLRKAAEYLEKNDDTS